VTFVGCTCSFARGAEGLAWAGACPNRSVIAPSGETQGDAPSSDAGEEVALCVSSEVICLHILDAALVDVACRDLPGRNEIAKPLRGVRVDLVIIRGQSSP
jgi:hypothetical protein